MMVSREFSIICLFICGDNEKNITFSPVFKKLGHSGDGSEESPEIIISSRMRKNILFTILVVFAGSAGYSQQTSLITQYMHAQMFYNPGFAGSNEGICATGLARQQWIGAPGQPTTFFISIDAPLKFLHGGVGASVIQDQVAAFNNTQVKIDYAYRAELGTGSLGIGAEVIMQNSKTDFDKLKAVDTGDPLLIKNTGKQSGLIFDMSLGAFYKVPDKYYIGLSALQLLQSKVKNDKKEAYYTLRRTYTLNGGYYWPVPNHPGFELQPAGIILFDGAVLQAAVDAILVYNKKISGGLGFRYQDGVASIPILIGMTLKNFRIGISYDVGTSGSSFNNSGSLELMLNYCFKIEAEKFRKSYKNTRFL
jgi:type IX secretion system PorP/SprF family membrane protein